jgi:Glycosyltransferase family 87
MWFYVNRILVPYQRADAAAHDRPRGNLSDLYPRWLGSRELLLHQRNPYSREITHEIQVGYYGRELDATRPGDPIDQQGFAYPVYVAFLLAPTVGLPFDRVTIAFEWLLVILTAASVPLWFRVVGWRPQVYVLLIALILTLGSFPAVQGLKLQQLTLVVAAVIAAAIAFLVRGHLFAAGVLLAVATIKPQLVLPIVLWLLLWGASDWRRRQRFFWGFGLTMVVLLGGSELLLPGWLENFVSATQDYRRYAGGMSMLDVLLSPWWGRVAGVVAIAAVAAVCWRLRKQECTDPAFRLVVAVVLVVTLMVIPMFAPYNTVLALPAIFLVGMDWGFLWKRSALSRTGLLLAVGAVGWPWLAALGLATAAVFVAPAVVQRAWWLPLYSFVKMPVPLVCLVPMSFLVARAWREPSQAVE